MAREVNKGTAANFLEKAREFCDAALLSYQAGHYNASTFAAAQAIILANDAVCIAALGQRASKDHREAIELHVQACAGRESKKDVLSQALDKRTEFGYTEKESSNPEANRLLLQAKRFIAWAAERVR